MFPKFAQGDILVGATIHYPDPVYRCIMSEQGLLIRPIPKPPNYCQYAEGARVKILLPPLSQTHYFSTTLNTILRECDGGSISGTGFAIEDFQPLHVKRAIENGRRNRFDVGRHRCLLGKVRNKRLPLHEFCRGYGRLTRGIETLAQIRPGIGFLFRKPKKLAHVYPEASS